AFPHFAQKLLADGLLVPHFEQRIVDAPLTKQATELLLYHPTSANDQQGHGRRYRNPPHCPAEAIEARTCRKMERCVERALFEAAADRWQKVDFAVFLDRVEQAAHSHLAVDRNGDARFQIAVFDQMGLDAREL